MLFKQKKIPKSNIFKLCLLAQENVPYHKVMIPLKVLKAQHGGLTCPYWYRLKMGRVVNGVQGGWGRIKFPLQINASDASY